MNSDDVQLASVPDSVQCMGLSTTLLLCIYLFGWIKAYHEMQKIRLDDVKGNDFSMFQLLAVSWDMVLPYFSVWTIIIIGIIALFLVDKILVAIVSINASGHASVSNSSYSTRMFLACLTQWQVLGAVLMTMGVVLGGTLAFMYWVRLQRRYSKADLEAILQRGMCYIHVFGLGLGLCVIGLQGFWIGRTRFR
jgi:hypothetical protein